MKTQLTRITIVAHFVMITACGILPKASAVHDFGNPQVNASIDSDNSTQTAQITVDAPKWVNDNRLHYRLLYADPTQVRSYALDRWIAPPPELLEQLLNNSGKHWPVSVSINLQVFEQQFTAPNKAKVVIHFSAATTPDDNHHQTARRNFSLELPCPTADANGAVTGFNSLTQQVVDKIQSWLANNV